MSSAAPAAGTVFGLVRHARTEWNRQKRMQGQSDSPLTPDGVKAAEKWGRLLADGGWERIVSSDLGRAVETAKRINETLNLPLETDARFREQDWGRWTGRRIRELEAEAPDLLAATVRKGWGFSAPGGEDRESVVDRATAALLDLAGQYPGERILVVSHEGVMKCLLYRLLGRRFLPGEPPVMKPRRLHIVQAAKKVITILEMNVVDLSDGIGDGE